MTTTTTDLAGRILDAFPTGKYGLLGLLRVLEIEESDSVETAAIECRALPRMLVNRAFVDTFAATPEKLMMLVLHELHHLLLGHTRLFQRPTPAHNLVFDAVINAMLCRMFPAPQYTSFFTEFYSDKRFPECFLRPPARWNLDRAPGIPPALRKRASNEATWAYKALYSNAGIGYEELFRQLATQVVSSGVRLLGNHNEEVPSLESSPALFGAVREVVEEWPMPPNPIAGRSWSSLLRTDKVAVAERVSDRERLSSLIRRIARKGCGGRSGWRGGMIEATAPAERPDRRSAVMRRLGVDSLLFRTELWSPTRREALERVHVYLDVSGSVTYLLPVLYAAVCSCRELVNPSVHLFSTEVHDVSLRQLKSGECRTTGGTCIGCVAEHMRKNRIRRAILVTDGAVGRPYGEYATTLERALLGVALTPGYSIRTDLEPYADFITDLKGNQ